MNITPEELQELRIIAEQVASGKELEEVTVTYVEDGQEKTIVFRDPMSLWLFKKALQEVHQRHNLEQ